MKSVGSLQEFQSHLKNDDKVFLLLFNSASEKGNCAKDAIEQAYESSDKVGLFSADVSSVRDIHIAYEIKTAPSLLEFEGTELKNVLKGCSDVSYYKSIFEGAVYHAETKNDEKPQKRVVVYSTPTCSWCTTLKNHLKQHKIRFTDVDVSKDQNAAEELVRRSGQRGVPQTDINGEIIVGFNKPRINELLQIKG
jgi:glutaredoxin-like YruB-family protein